jgi:hypothetical protein
MPGSQTTQGQADARITAPAHFAFRQVNNVGTLIDNDFAAQWLAYTLPYRRFADTLAEACARLGAGVDRYSFTVMDLHHLLLAGLPAHSLALRPAHSRGHQFVTRYPKASDISSPPCLLRLLPAGAVAGWAFHPLERCRLSTAHTHSSRLLWLTEATLPISAGGSSKQEQRWRENGSEPQVEAASKRQEADPVRCECRAAAQQSPLRSRRWPRSAVLGLHGKRCCAPDHSRAKRRALRLHVQQGVPVPRRQATPLARIADNPCESWPRPSQTVAQHGPPYPSACRVVFHGGQTEMTTDILRRHATDESGDHFSAASSGANSR